MASIEGKGWTEQELNFWDYKLDSARYNARRQPSLRLCNSTKSMQAFLTGETSRLRSLTNRPAGLNLP